ncbi:MAG: imidazole glycerol phosphate synthase subunit HisH [Acidobacteria bacterium]|nr:imidazole glycerol phosphate synthase subunit HisH [Acidobacteriota bacterium]
MIGLLDYGSSNLRSVEKALRHLGVDCFVVAAPGDLERANRLVFPGQGHFGQMIQGLKARGLLESLRRYLQADRPYLGICLGMQALFGRSEEDATVEGLGLLEGAVRRFRIPPKVPHMGWNQVRRTRRSWLLDGVPDDAFAYFVHSYYVAPQDPQVVSATTEYGETFCSMLEVRRIFATQFHPEKSGDVGLRILKNFIQV